MSNRMWSRHFSCVPAIAMAAAAMPAISLACCPSGGNGPTAAATGLGDPAPATADVSTDLRWSVYEFARGGVHYTRVDDAYGNVMAVVGNVGSTAWVLPAGTDPNRVLLPGDAIPVGDRRTIVKSTRIEVVVIEATDGLYWFISPAETTDY